MKLTLTILALAVLGLATPCTAEPVEKEDRCYVQRGDAVIFEGACTAFWLRRVGGGEDADIAFVAPNGSATIIAWGKFAYEDVARKGRFYLEEAR
jgi:hypothetical protein